MTKAEAVDLIWGYMHMGHALKKADLIFLLGSIDKRVGHHAAKLFKESWSERLAISGDGTKHVNRLLKNPYGGKTEAEVLKQVAVEDGVPESAIIIEDKANNTGENFNFTTPILKENGVEVKTVIVVQKPYMERRAYATGKIWWPEVEIILSSPPGSFSEYVGDTLEPDEVINIMVGDLQRIKEYPKKGFQIGQGVPNEVWNAFEYLVSLGYNKNLIK